MDKNTNTANTNCIIITGEGKQGQILYATSFLEEALHYGQTSFHNGCSNEGFRITETSLSSDEQFAELMNIAPNESLFIIADADSVPVFATETTSNEQKWHSVCQEKNHMVVLTTMRGREHYISTIIDNLNGLHIQVEANKIRHGLDITIASGLMKERVPRKKTFIDHNQVMGWVKLTNGEYKIPDRPQDELIINTPKSIVVPADFIKAVLSTETQMPKHPENSFILTRVAKHNEHNQVRITEIISLVWLESENKHSDEEFAIHTAAWACEKWGISLTNVTANKETTYPDGWAKHNGTDINIEVTKVQPRWPSGATLATLTAGTRSGKTKKPDKSPLIQCNICGTIETSDTEDVHKLPPHNESHFWTCTYPSSMIATDYPEDLTALPELHINSEHFIQGINNAIREKSDRAKRFGADKPNWLVLIIEGFPPTDGLYEEMLHCNQQGIDGIIAIMSQEFRSAIHSHYPEFTQSIVLVKCPEQDTHYCYHPGLTMFLPKYVKESAPLLEFQPVKGITHQFTASDGTILAEYEETPPQPFTHLDSQKEIVRKGIKHPLPYLISQDC